jgi:hypothetical protein
MTAVSLKASPENEQSEIQLEVIEEVAKKYLQYFYGPDLLDKGIIIVPKALKQIYKEIGITLTEYAVMELLLSRWYREKAQPEVSIAILATELGKSKLQIWRHLKKLQQKGMLGIEHIYDEDGAQRHNRYDIFPFIRHLDAYVNNRNHHTRADTPFVANEQSHNETAQPATHTPLLTAASSETPITGEPGEPQSEEIAAAQLAAVTATIIQQESSPERVEPIIAALPPTQHYHTDEPFQLPPPALGPKTPGRSPQLTPMTSLSSSHLRRLVPRPLVVVLKPTPTTSLSNFLLRRLVPRPLVVVLKPTPTTNLSSSLLRRLVPRLLVVSCRL